ncbi:chaperone modulatory protein CbpM [Hoeflea marina]|uniref:Chaperone modulatory protein CbpM n=1 Tax=Hoeflea marina TaxID=274592 RepID=A0A317PPY8_9HYPH|nr:hypothetical protein [Hoeflea marina]PWW01998.1 chaperone modulatory protein CbpM [Hoeflea marina]
MIVRYTEDQVIATVHRLTRSRLLAFVEAEVVSPMESEQGPMYLEVDVARLELLCELNEHFELEGDALGVVISLIDQLHGVRHDLDTVLRVIAREAPDVRQRIGSELLGSRRKRP